MKPLTILIVDDHPINLKLLRAQLEAEGHAVVEAANGAEALALMDRKTVDVIVSDILMPVMDGYRSATKCGAANGFASCRSSSIPPATFHPPTRS
jgi:CheY-like chemotaxis protein